MEFSRQEYWSGLSFPSPEDLPDPGIEPWSPALQADSLPFELQGSPQSESETRSTVLDSLQPHELYSPWNSPGQNTEVGSLSLLQGILPIQGLKPGLPHCRRILYQLSHKGSPRILEWVAYPFPRGSFWPRNQTGVSYIAGIFFTNRAMREAKKLNESESEETLRDPLLDFSIMLRY